MDREYKTCIERLFKACGVNNYHYEQGGKHPLLIARHGDAYVASPQGLYARQRFAGHNKNIDLRGHAEVLIERFAGDPEVTGECGFRLAGVGSAAQFSDLLDRKGLPSAAINSALLGQGDPFALSFADQRSLEFGDGPNDREHKCRHWGVFAGEHQVLLDELDLHAAGGERLNEVPQIVEVACQAIHAVHHQRIALTDEREHGIELRSLGVLARGLVGEDPIECGTIELAIDILILAADSDVADPLSIHRIIPEVSG